LRATFSDEHCFPDVAAVIEQGMKETLRPENVSASPNGRKRTRWALESLKEVVGREQPNPLPEGKSKTRSEEQWAWAGVCRLPRSSSANINTILSKPAGFD
jgi:hypothetical protein